MPLTLPISQSAGFDLHEPDEWYDGHIDSIQETPEGQYGPGLKFIFILNDEDDRETWGYTSQKLSPKSRLFAWLNGLGVNLEGDTVDLNTVVGSTCQVMFERYMGSSPEGQPVEKEKVIKVRAPKGGTKKTATRPKPAPVADALDAPF